MHREDAMQSDVTTSVEARPNRAHRRLGVSIESSVARGLACPSA